MINTRIYRRYQMKKLTLFLVGILGLYLILVKPVQAFKEVKSNQQPEKAPVIRSIEETQEVLAELASSITAEELYIIFTQSNEYIQIVDARSEKEYKEKHIERAMHVETFNNQFDERYPAIRVFFYSNNTDRSKKIANEYAERGVKAYYVVGGLTEWEKLPGYFSIQLLNSLSFLVSE